MRWLIKFRQQQKHCCPPSDYWIVRTREVEAEDLEQAIAQLKKHWRVQWEFEIKEIKEITDEQNQGE